LTIGRTIREAILLFAGLFLFRKKMPGDPGKRRVAFQAYARHLAQFQVPLIRELGRRGSCEIYFVIAPHPQFDDRERRQLRDLALAAGVPADRVIPYWKTLWWKLDLLVVVDMLALLPLRTTRTCFLAHGAAFARRVLDGRWPRRRLLDFDLVLPTGTYDVEAVDDIRRKLRSSRPVVEAVGCPLLDRLFATNGSRRDYCARMGLAEERPLVLYAPHWTDLERWGREGERRLYEVVRALTTLHVNLVLKPHAMAFVRGAVSGRHWRATMENLQTRTVRLDPDADDTAALSSADVLITGTSSRAFNMMLVDKPVVLFPASPASADPILNKRLRALSEGSSVAAGLPELVEQVRTALVQPHARSEARRRQARAQFANPGQATAAAVGVLYRELGVMEN
jgi:hypothetical protein